MELNKLLLSASILSANYAHIARDVKRCESVGIDFVHIDLTDGHYTDNLTFGFKLISDLKNETKLPIDIHLGISDPDRFVDTTIKAGADIINLQFETTKHPLRAIRRIKDSNLIASMTFNPTTSIGNIIPFLPFLDRLNFLAVEPGFEGQPFTHQVLEKIQSIHSIIKENRYKTLLSVDGSVNSLTIPKIINSGADALIMGSAVFNDDKIEDNVLSIIKLIKKHFD